ncbi:hypothetical protein GCM10009854_42340 [Saccharopolyspora halophila]|uniref:Uncharacterized protein n=1 Tax=Saccharopolyspora halophila TaxID=405551 RepID=A0ABN3GRW0_9PSEU
MYGDLTWTDARGIKHIVDTEANSDPRDPLVTMCRIGVAAQPGEVRRADCWDCVLAVAGMLGSSELLEGSRVGI